MAKYYSSQVAQSVSGSAIEWAGGLGFTRETGIEKYWRDSKIVSASKSSVLEQPSESTVPGSHLRRDVQHSATNYRKVCSKGVLIIVVDCMETHSIIML